LLSGTLANRPTPEVANATWGGANFGLLYFSTDNGKIYQWNGGAWVDITANFITGGGGGGYKLENANATPVTVSNSVAELDLMSFSLPANELAAGQTIRVFGAFRISNGTGGNQSVTMKGYIGNNVVVSNIAGTLIIAAGIVQGFIFEMWATCVGAGAGGSIEAHGEIFSANGPDYLDATSVLNNAIFAFDTTVAEDIEFTVQFGAANVNLSATQRQMVIERLG
jgi:hypothetical protein